MRKELGLLIDSLDPDETATSAPDADSLKNSQSGAGPNQNNSQRGVAHHDGARPGCAETAAQITLGFAETDCCGPDNFAQTRLFGL